MTAGVLIVEDDPQFRSAVARDLSHRGFRVTSAVSLPEALERVREGVFDVVVTDSGWMSAMGSTSWSN